MSKIDMSVYQLLPPVPSTEIPRGPLVKQIAAAFGQDCQQQKVIGAPQTGKTNLLAQFVREHSGLCISYFITPSPLTQRQHTFLYSMCLQLSVCLDTSPPPANIGLEDLKSLFSTMSFRLAERAKMRSIQYYYVIDGLERGLQGLPDDRIVDLFPLETSPRSPYLLYSCRSERLGELPDCMECPARRPMSFNRLESKTYLAELGLTSEDIDRVHDKYEGVPGYLKIIREAKLADPEFDLESAPERLDRLVRQHVDLAVQASSDSVVACLEILAAAPTSLPIQLLADFADVADSALTECLQRTGLVNWDTQDGRVECSNELIRDSLRERMGQRLSAVVGDLSEHVKERYPDEEYLLTLLLREARDYEGLRDTLTGKAIVSAIDNTRDTSSVLRRLRLASEMARQNDEVDDLIRWSLTVAAAKSFVSHALSSEEIGALLSIGSFQDALSRAYAMPEKSVKIRLLARAYAAKKVSGERLRRSTLDELGGMVKSLDLEGLDKEVAEKIAIDLLPVLPDIAFSLLEETIGKGEERSIVEVAIGALETRLEEAQRERDSSMHARDREELGHVADLLSSWLDGLSLSRLLEELKSVENTRAREYVIRQWCRQNAESEEVGQGIDLWLDTVIEDGDCIVPLRSLRHISEVVTEVPLCDRLRLVDRLRVPAFTALDSPKQEWVRFHLNLAEALVTVDKKNARARITEVHKEVVGSSLDLDVEVFCLARVWAAISHVFPEDSQWASDVERLFDKAFRCLLGASAEQYEAVVKTLQSLIRVDPVCALTAASELNTHSRRSRAIIAVLETTLRDCGQQDLAAFIDSALEDLNKRERVFALDRVTSRLNALSSALCTSNLHRLLDYAEEITDPAIKCRILGNLAVLSADISPEQAIGIMERAISAWKEEEDLRVRLSLGFRMVEKTSELDLDRAKQLCEEVRRLRFQPGSALAIGELGPLFRETIDLAIRAVTLKDLSDSDLAVQQLEQLISRIPARVTQVHLFARLAATAYRVGLDQYAHSLVRTRVIRGIEQVRSEYDRNVAVRFSLPVIFEYDVETARRLAAPLPYPERDRAWQEAVFWSLCRSFLGDHKLDPKDIRVRNDYPRLKMTIEAANEIHHDVLFCGAIEAIAKCVKNSVKSKIDRMQALDILLQLDQLALSQLPERDVNIKHDGYLILAQAYVHGVRSHIYRTARRKRGMSKSEIGRRWLAIAEDARDIPNIADCVFVMALIAAEMLSYYSDDLGPARDLLEEADSLIADIPTLIDRVDRLQTIAESYSLLSDTTQAEVILEKAFELASQLEGASADDRLGVLVQAAHQVDPQLADELVSRLDTRLPEAMIHPATVTFNVERLISAPSKLCELREACIMTGAVLGKAAQKLLRDFAAGKGTVVHTSVLEDWLMRASLQHPRVTIDVAHWVTESLHRKGAKPSRESRLDTFVDIAQLTAELARWVSEAETLEGVPEAVHDSFPGLNARVISFGAGEVERARKWLQNWLVENVDGYLKICDPYFGIEQIEYLKYVPLDCKVLIVTTDRGLDPRGGPEKVEHRLKTHWSELASRALPSLQVLIIPRRLESKFHDRAIITSRAGLDIGQSLNGIGKSRGKITVLSEEDARELESVYVDEMLSNATWFMEGVHPTVCFLGGSTHPV